MKINLQEHEVLEDLCLGGPQIIQNKNLYRFTSDSVILANFVRTGVKDSMLDIGTGSGIIPILVGLKTLVKHIDAVEVQLPMAEMATRSIELNNLSNRIQVFNCDIKNFKNGVQYDVITCNPPYKKAGTSKPNQNHSKSIARHEVLLNLSQLCLEVKKRLKFGGRFYVCMDADRACELIFELKKVSLEPKKMFFSQSSISSKANIVFVEAIHGGKEGVMVLPCLITNDTDGKYLEQIKKMRY